MPTWNDLKSWLGQTVVDASIPVAPAPAAHDLSTDTRSIKKGDWFVPLCGKNFDGHDYIGRALADGATGFFYNKTLEAKIPVALRAKGLAVTDTLEAMQAYASGWRHTLTKIKIAALTGSTGKTTCKELLGGIFKQAGATFATQASFNNEIGVPKTLLQLKPSHQFAALEFGARMPGNIRFLVEMAQPDIVGLINVGMTHVGVFGTLDKLLATKCEIFDFASEQAIQIACHDDARILAGARKTGKKTISFGHHKDADIRIVDCLWREGASMSCTLAIFDQKISVQFKTAHEALAINAAAAAALASAAGVQVELIKVGLESYQGIKGRYQVHHKGALTIVDDTYNASPDSMLAGLGSLAKTFPSQHKCLVLGDMLELGPISAEQHRLVGAKGVAPLKPQCLVTIGNDAKFIADGAVSEGYPASNIHSYTTVDDLIASQFPFSSCDVVYAKASNGIRLSKLIEHLLDGSL